MSCLLHYLGTAVNGSKARADLAGDRDVAGPRPAEVEQSLFLEDALGALGLVERHLARHQDVQYHAYRPHVRLLRVVRAALRHHSQSTTKHLSTTTAHWSKWYALTGGLSRKARWAKARKRE